MPTRLTNAVRKKIIDAVIAGTTLQARREVIEASARMRARAFIVGEQPREFVERIKGLPVNWFHTACILTVRYYNPLKVLDAMVVGRHSLFNITFDDPVAFALYVLPDEERCKTVFGDLFEEAEKLVDEYFTLKRSLGGYLSFKHTVESAVAGMPELEPYIPKDATAVNYPVATPSNLVDLLQKAGLGTKPAKAAP